MDTVKNEVQNMKADHLTPFISTRLAVRCVLQKDSKCTGLQSPANE